MLLDEWDRRFTDGGSEVADVKVDAVAFRLRKRGVPTVPVDLRMVVVAQPDSSLCRNCSEPCGQIRTARKFEGNLVRSKRSCSIEVISQHFVRRISSHAGHSEC